VSVLQYVRCILTTTRTPNKASSRYVHYRVWCLSMPVFRRPCGRVSALAFFRHGTWVFGAATCIAMARYNTTRAYYTTEMNVAARGFLFNMPQHRADSDEGTAFLTSPHGGISSVLMSRLALSNSGQEWRAAFAFAVAALVRLWRLRAALRSISFGCDGTPQTTTNSTDQGSSSSNTPEEAVYTAT